MAACLSKTLKLKRSLPCSFQSSSPRPLAASFSSNASPPTAAATDAAAPASSASQSQEKERGKLSKALLFLPGAITFGLGTWQLFRRQEKIELLDYRRKRLEMEPLDWNELSSSNYNWNTLEFRKIICEGDFDESKSVYIGPRSRSISGLTENGFYVITPLVPRRTEPGSVQVPVLVNRGWVPHGWRQKSLRNSESFKSSSIAGTVEAKENEGSTWWKFWSKRPEALKVEEDAPLPPTRVVGVIRGSEEPSIFVPENDPSSGQWFYVNVPMIARACALPENTLYIEDINEDFSATNPYPVPKDVNKLIRYSIMPQDHLNYTLTWFIYSSSHFPILKNIFRIAVTIHMLFLIRQHSYFISDFVVLYVLGTPSRLLYLSWLSGGLNRRKHADNESVKLFVACVLWMFTQNRYF